MAVKLITGPPASGKKDYIKKHISESLQSVPSEEILILTNSKKSALHFKESARRILESYPELWCESITSFCKKVLRENYHLSRDIKPGFRVVSDFEKRLIVRNILKNRKSPGFVSGFGSGLVKDISDFLDIAKRNPGWNDNIKKFSRPLSEKYSDFDRIEKIYSKTLKKFNYLDFVDLTLFTAKLLEKHKDVMKFKKIFIYEAEDMDSIMTRIVISLLKNASDSVVSLSQGSSIYRFRGARPRYFRDKLERNFNPEVKIMNVPGTARREYLISGYTRDEQARAAASHIAEDIKSGIRPERICIISRSSGETMESFTDALKSRGINYIIGGGVGFFRQKEIIDLLSFLRCTLEGFNSPDLDIQRTIIAIGALNADRLDSLRIKQQLTKKSFDEVFAKEYTDEYNLFKEKLSSLLKESEGLSAAAFVYRIMEELDFLKKSADCEFLASLYSYFLRVVEEFSEHFKKFNGKTLTFKIFMENLFDLLKGFGKDMDIPYAPELEAVRIITVQQSKGEEFEKAYLVDMNEDEFPRPYRENPLLSSQDRKNLDLRPFSGVDDQYEFEKRLFNIARTRGQDTVYCWYKTDDSGARADISPFVSERELSREQFLTGEKIIDIHDFLLKAAAVIPAEDMDKLRKSEKEGKMKSALEFLKKILEFDSETLCDKVKRGLPEKYSATALNSFTACPRKFFYSQILKIKEPPSVNQFLGIAAHRLLEVIHKESIDEYEKAVRKLKQIWGNIGFYSVFESRNLFKTVRNMIESYYLCIDKEKFEVITTEESFETDFRGVTLTGRYDRIDRLVSGGERVVDYKSGKSVKMEVALLNNVERGNDFQIPVYYWARRPSPAIFSIYWLRRESEKMRVDIDFSKERPAEVIRKAGDLLLEKVEQISSGKFGDGPLDANACRMCYFKRICDIDDD